jgi:hypothetical protein
MKIVSNYKDPDEAFFGHTCNSRCPKERGKNAPFWFGFLESLESASKTSDTMDDNVSWFGSKAPLKKGCSSTDGQIDTDQLGKGQFIVKKGT